MAVSTTEPTAVTVEAAAPLRARRLKLPRSPKVLIGLGLLIAFGILAVIGPLIAPTTRRPTWPRAGRRSRRRPRTGSAPPRPSRTSCPSY